MTTQASPLRQGRDTYGGITQQLALFICGVFNYEFSSYTMRLDFHYQIKCICNGVYNKISSIKNVAV
jgi:hypothetical protein